MSTTASLSAEPEEVVQDSQEMGSAELLDSAKRAFSDHDFRTADEFLDRIPSADRTDEVRQLQARAQQLKNTQLACEEAEECLKAGDYTVAFRMLERIPLGARTEASKEMLVRANELTQLQEITDSAHAEIRQCNFAAAVAILEEIPKEKRTEDIVALIQDAYYKQRQLAELQQKAKAKLEVAAEVLTISAYAEVLPLLNGILELAPADAEAKRQLDEVCRLQESISERDRLHASAVERFEDRDYASAIGYLNRTEESIRTPAVIELLSLAEDYVREIKQLTESIFSAIRTAAFQQIPSKLDRLGELQNEPVSKIAAQLTESAYGEFLTALIWQVETDSAMMRLLESFLCHFQHDRLFTFLEAESQVFLDNYPESGTELRAKLNALLDELSDHPNELPRRLSVLQTARRHLHEDEERLAAWEELVKLLDVFDEHQQQPWKWTDSLVGNARTIALEAAARELTKAARIALPKKGDRWERLQRVGGDRFTLQPPIIKRVYRKIEESLNAKEWSSRPITLITLRRALQAAVAVVLLGLLGSAMQILMSLLFNVGGYTGYVLVGFLVGLYSVFWYAANRIL